MNAHNILAVDDDTRILSALTQALKSEYNIFPATCGEDALNIMENEDITLVISDQKMDGMTGVELMEKLAKKYPDTIRMIITGYAEDDVLINAINLGNVYGFIPKPWKIDELRAIVKKGINHYEKSHILRKPHVQALLRRGILSMEQLESVIHANNESQKSICDILVEYGMVPDKEMETATRYGRIEQKECYEILIERGLISESDLEIAREKQKLGTKSLTKTLVDLEYADEDSILVCYSMQLGIPYIPLTQFSSKEKLSKLLPSQLAYKYNIVPVDVTKQTIVVAVSEPLSERAKLEIKEETGKRIMTVLAKHRDIEKAIGSCYSDESN